MPRLTEYGLHEKRHARAPAWVEQVAGKTVQRLDRVAEFGVDRKGRQEACPFCNHEQHLPPLKVGKDMMVIPGKLPPFPGHALIVPLGHKESITELNKKELGELGDLLQKIHRGSERTGRKVYFGFNWRRIAAQSVTHLHLHVLPRNPKGLPGLTEPTNIRFFDPLAAQVIKKVQNNINTRRDRNLFRDVKFSEKIAGPIRIDFRNIEHFKQSGWLLRQLYKIADKEYSKLLRNPDSAEHVPAYGDKAEVYRQRDIRLLRGELPGRTNRLKQQASEQEVELPEQILKELVRSHEVGIMVRILILQNNKVRIELLPRATVVKPASPKEALQGKRDIGPWGASIIGPGSVHPFRETLDKPTMTPADRAKWDKDTSRILGNLRKTLNKR
ncbi:MAG: HIT domain-containing protein [Candidatus Micrarchaeota archaeon]